MAYVLFGFLMLVAIILCLFIITSVWTLFVGKIPYLGTPAIKVKKMLDLAHLKKGDLCVDLGSGDGRIVIEAAKRGAYAYGYELNFFYVLLSYWNIYRSGMWGKAHIYWRNFFSENLSKFDVIIVYAISYVMPKVEKKIQKEKKDGAKVISNIAKLPNLHPIKTLDNIYLYY